MPLNFLMWFTFLFFSTFVITPENFISVYHLRKTYCSSAGIWVEFFNNVSYHSWIYFLQYFHNYSTFLWIYLSPGCVIYRTFTLRVIKCMQSQPKCCLIANSRSSLLLQIVKLFDNLFSYVFVYPNKKGGNCVHT